MTIEEFLEKFNYAPYELYEVAELLSDVTDNKEASGIANAFLEIKENFEMILDKIGFEFG